MCYDVEIALKSPPRWSIVGPFSTRVSVKFDVQG